MKNTLTPQTPALGIMLQVDWDDAKIYHVDCSCTDPDHSHQVSIEADPDLGVSVEIFITAETPIWKVSRWKLIWQLLTKGSIKYNTTLIMNEQQSINYATALMSAVNDVKKTKDHK